MTDPLAPYFLGAYGENNDVFERVMLELVRDHVYWRRNFHPEDLPPIGTAELHSAEYLDGVARTRQELHRLTAALKRSVPFFHPRYLGHMVSDLLLPGLIAQLVTTLYNPNNVVEDAAPVTVDLELEVARQLARMLGLPSEEDTQPRALGHLTSGGTVANDEALWLARTVKLFPLAVKDALAVPELRPLSQALSAGWGDGSVEREDDDYSWLNLAPDQVVALLGALDRLRHEHELGARLWEEVGRRRPETVGLARFCAAHPVAAEQVVLAPGTAHYSVQKAMKLLGLGTDALLELPTVQARIDPAALEEALVGCVRARRPVLMVIGVYGTTEFGTLDPVDELVSARRLGAGFWLHVDAAWGGYIPSLFRTPEGHLRPRAEVAREMKYFPSERVYRATAALGQADSVTVDPHKLGFVPYGAGAFLVRDRRHLQLMQQDAPYVFHSHQRPARGGAPDAAEQSYRRLGRLFLEGSKPGAAAAACYVNHRVLPLHSERFGRLIARSVHNCELLYDRVATLAAELASEVRLVIPFEPDCNLLCLAVNPRGNRSLRASNAFTRRLFDAMGVRGDRPVQLRDFFGSCTTVGLSHLGDSELRRVGALLELDLVSADDDGLFLLRHTLMNPWLQSSPARDERSYLEEYAQFLTGLIREALAAMTRDE